MLDRYSSPEALAEVSNSPVEVCRMVFALGGDRAGIVALRSEVRERPLCRKRMAIIYAAKSYERFTLRPIGRAINRDFSQVSRAFREAIKLQRRDAGFRRMCEGLRR